MSAEQRPDDAADAALRPLRSRAQRSNLARVSDLETLLGLAADGRLDHGGRRRAVELAHQVLGSAGTFGYVGASELAAGLERLLRGGDLSDVAHLDEAARTLAALRRALTDEGPWTGAAHGAAPPA